MNAELVELSDGVFAWIHDVQDRFTCNVGVLVEDDSLTLVDTSGRPSSYNMLQKALRRFNRPVTQIVLTHEHGDHVAGVVAFPDAAILGSRSCAESLSMEPATPFLQLLHPSISSELSSLRHPELTKIIEAPRPLGRHGRIELLKGHTDCDLVVYIPDADAVFAGDLCFFDHVPLGIGADFSSWCHSIETLKGAGVSHVVPGHGPIGGRRELDVVASYLSAVLETAAKGERMPAGPWSEWWDPWGHKVEGAIDRINVEQARSPGEVPATLVELLS